jgi:hypothetical protein
MTTLFHVRIREKLDAVTLQVLSPLSDWRGITLIRLEERDHVLNRIWNIWVRFLAPRKIG